MRYFDTHSHLTLCADEITIEDHVKACIDQGVSKVLDPGLYPSDFKKRHELLSKYKDIIYMGIALAPHCINHSSSRYLSEIEEIIKEYKPIAISEIGLDYRINSENKKEQKEIFSNQLNLSKKYDLPVFLHIRDAYRDTAEVVRSIGAHKGAVHCFSGGIEEARMFLDLGFFISFSGIVTFKNAHEVRQALNFCPMDKILGETDSPYLSPVPYRGRPNRSYYVKETINFIAIEKGGNVKNIVEKIYQNSLNILSLS